MANSKSNIYPIQLQGAELNLNKYDAEIKQYSGFNKNNSPFVGGCLSNVFTKEEQITGGNADNTYIDTNGDIYTVDDYGFLKNGEPIGFRSDTPLEFWDVEEFQTPEGEIVYYLSNDAYAVKLQGNDNKIYVDIHLGGKVRRVNAGSYPLFVTVIIEKFHDETIGDFYCASMKRYSKSSLNNNQYSITCGVYTQYGDYEIKDAQTNIYVNSIANPSFADPCLDYKDGNVFFAINDGDVDTHVTIMSFVNDTGGKKLQYLPNFVNGINSFIDGTDSLYFYFFRKGKCYLYRSKTFTEGSTVYCIINYTFSASGVSIVSREQSFTAVSGHINSLINSEFYNYIFKKYGVEYCLYSRTNFTSEGCVLKALCDFSTDGITYTEDGQVIFSTGGVIKNCILTNNGLVSGIALPGADILATEWNCVDRDLIFFSEGFGSTGIEDNYVIYKNINNGKCYKIFRTETKKIKFINNQIIANYNNKWNAYDIRRNKKLWYANAWNNRCFYGSNADIWISKNTHIPENLVYFASSYNEYNQADNSSVLFNPVPVLRVSNVNVTLETDKEGINYYVGEIDTGKINYACTAGNVNNIRDKFVNRKLKGLPFPIDTNGNIQLCPSLFADYFSTFGNDVFIKENDNTYQLSKSDNQIILSYYFGTLIEGLQKVFILQGQYYGVINDQIFAIQFNNGVVASQISIVSVKNLQFVGNTPYEALFFSKTNRCLYSFTGANVLNQKQLVDKISEVRNYLYNPATQTVFLITDIGVLFYGLFGMFLLEYTDITNIFLLDNGIVMSDNSGNYRYIKYYLDEGDEGYTKENIRLETCFYGMNNEVVTINDCLYFRLFSEEHEEGDLKVKATTISLKGRQTEETTFKIKASDWDKITHTIYLRYQPKTQRGLGVSFSIDSPFKIASMSVGSQPDAVLVDRVSKGAITAPSVTTNNNEW